MSLSSVSGPLGPLEVDTPSCNCGQPAACWVLRVIAQGSLGYVHRAGRSEMPCATRDMCNSHVSFGACAEIHVAAGVAFFLRLHVMREALISPENGNGQKNVGLVAGTSQP